MSRPRVVVFDVNETLLDLTGMRDAFVGLVGSTDRMGEWFALLLHGSLVANEVGRHRSFGAIGADALMGLCRKLDIDVDRSTVEGVVGTMESLPPHPDVPQGLTRLREAGFRLVALSNGSTESLDRQVRNAGLDAQLERWISVDEIGRYKPSPAVYLHTTAVLDVEIDEALMVAAHDWDIVGARSVGMPGAFVERAGVGWALPEPEPEIVVSDIGALADRLAG